MGLKYAEEGQRIGQKGEQGHRAEGFFSQLDKFKFYFQFKEQLVSGFKYKRGVIYGFFPYRSGTL